MTALDAGAHHVTVSAPGRLKHKPWHASSSLGCDCVGLHAVMALDASAYHVTAVERWLYLSLACKLQYNTMLL